LTNSWFDVMNCSAESSKLIWNSN